MDKGKKIIFQTADKETVEEYSHIFQRSVFLKGVLDDYPNDTKLNLEQITKPQFLKIIEYLKHYENVDPPKIERPLKSLDFKQCVIDINSPNIYNMYNLLIPEKAKEYNFGKSIVIIDPLTGVNASKSSYKVDEIYETFKDVIDEKSTLVHDADKSHEKLIKALNLKEELNK